MFARLQRTQRTISWHTSYLYEDNRVTERREFLQQAALFFAGLSQARALVACKPAVRASPDAALATRTATTASNTKYRKNILIATNFRDMLVAASCRS